VLEAVTTGNGVAQARPKPAPPAPAGRALREVCTEPALYGKAILSGVT
jgi:hypothetical protein